jgi:hypothetical protein
MMDYSHVEISNPKQMDLKWLLDFKERRLTCTLGVLCMNKSVCRKALKLSGFFPFSGKGGGRELGRCGYIVFFDFSEGK